MYFIDLLFRIKLEIGFKTLHNEFKVESLCFWGKISGEDSDYYIALGVNFTGHYEFPEKLFFYAPSSFVFNPLPETYVYHDKDFADNYHKPLKGNPALIITKYKEDIPEGEDGQLEENQPVEGDEEDGKPLDPDASVDENAPKKEEPKENFTESLKLSYLIRQIDYDTNIIPEGAFKLIPEHELRINQSFKGLDKNEVNLKKKFLHFRPVSEVKRKYLESDDSIFHFDILDSIEEDEVKCSWSVQLDSTKTLFNVRSLLWPGFFAVHKANSNIYCGCYFGNGIKNIELSFMV